MPRKYFARKVRRHYPRRMRSRRGSAHHVGLLPVIFGGGAAAVPFFANTNGQPSVVQRVEHGDFGGAGTQFLGTLTNPDALKDMIMLGLVAAAFGYAGKKLGSKNPSITKKVKVF